MYSIHIYLKYSKYWYSNAFELYLVYIVEKRL